MPEGYKGYFRLSLSNLIPRRCTADAYCIRAWRPRRYDCPWHGPIVRQWFYQTTLAIDPFDGAPPHTTNESIFDIRVSRLSSLSIFFGFGTAASAGFAAGPASSGAVLNFDWRLSWSLTSLDGDGLFGAARQSKVSTPNGSSSLVSSSIVLRVA